MKAGHQGSNNIFNELLELFKNILPSENNLPNSTYSAKKIMDSLLMECQIIHVCCSDCILYWREHGKMDSSPKCGVGRW